MSSAAPALATPGGRAAACALANPVRARRRAARPCLAASARAERSKDAGTSAQTSSQSAPGLLTMAELGEVAARRGVQLRVQSWGPLFRITFTERGRDVELGLITGFTVPLLGLVHFENMLVVSRAARPCADAPAWRTCVSTGRSLARSSTRGCAARERCGETPWAWASWWGRRGLSTATSGGAPRPRSWPSTTTPPSSESWSGKGPRAHIVAAWAADPPGAPHPEAPVATTQVLRAFRVGAGEGGDGGHPRRPAAHGGVGRCGHAHGRGHRPHDEAVEQGRRALRSDGKHADAAT